jgi:hypothetical protein
MSGDSTAQKIARKLPEPLMKQFVGLANIIYEDSESPLVALAVEGMALTICHNQSNAITKAIDDERLFVSFIIDKVSSVTEYSEEEIKSYCRKPLLRNETYLEYDLVDTDNVDELNPDQLDEIGREIQAHDLYDEFERQAYEEYGESDEALLKYVRHAMTITVTDLCISEMKLHVYELRIYSERLRQFVERKTKLTWEDNPSLIDKNDIDGFVDEEDFD